MDAEIMLENWCKKNNILADKIDNKTWSSAVSHVEMAIEGCLEHYHERNLEDGIFFINQELEEHPEWKEQTQKSNKTHNYAK